MKNSDIFIDIIKIWEDPSEDLVDLAKKLKCDPNSFYIGTSLEGVDIRDQDLSGLNLYGTNIEKSIINQYTLIDPEFDPRISDNNLRKRYLELDIGLLAFVDKLFNKRNFRSSGWFIKHIIRMGADGIRKNPSGWKFAIRNSKDLMSFLDSSRRHRVDLIINDMDYAVGAEFGKEFGGRSPAVTTLIIVGVSSLIGFDPKTDTASLSIDAILREFRLFPQFHGRYY